jgi:hypothetical protein
MWQVWHASGRRASAVENRWRVWHASHDALPNGPDTSRSSRCSSGDLRPILWHPPQPFSPSRIATGW